MLAIFEQLSHFEANEWSEGALLAPVEPKHWLKSLVAQLELETRLFPVSLAKLAEDLHIVIYVYSVILTLPFYTFSNL
jgi:hypothetical protein